jgi:FkbH-like protein
MSTTIDQADLFRSLTGLRKAGRIDEALALLRDALRRGKLSAEEIDRAGRFLQKAFDPGGGASAKALRVTLLGQCTTSWIVPALAAVAWGRGSAVHASEGGYDNVIQDLVGLQSAPARPDVVVLLPWGGRLAGRGDAPAQIVEDEVNFWRQAWGLVTGGLGARLIQVGYDWVTPGALGYHVAGRPGGPVRLVRELNAALQDALPEGAYFLDLDAVSGTLGRTAFYDMRRYYWTKQPFSEAGTVELARHLWAGVRALTTGPKKVLVLDLDNTLWGGVVGETGPHGIGLGESPEGEAFRAFQKHAKELADRGVVLAVASKNNPADAREPFEVNDGMHLKLDQIAAFEASWEPKGTTIARIAETLSLGLDSFVFFDDNPAEGEQVRQALPDVEVVDVPEEPAEFVRILQSGLWFETAGLTTADHERAGQYTVERQRRELQQNFTSLDDYLRSLEMTAEVRPIDEGEMPRVVQLLGKTNQFNLTTRRHTAEDVGRMLADPRSIGMTVRIRDKFGDYGLVAVMIGVPAEDEADAVRVDTWLMSCRVIGRTAEQFTLRQFLERAMARGYRRVVGEFLPTKKNALVAELYDRLGFARAEGDAPAEGGVRYGLDLDRAEPPVTFVTPVG